jgi:flagellar protein FlgJ
VAQHPSHANHRPAAHASTPHHVQHQARHGTGHSTFIHSAAVAAKQSEAATGVPASITIAQAILESGWGGHHIGKANNYFGVKAHTVHGKVDHGAIATGHVAVNTREHLHGKDVKVKANFRAYKDMAGSFTDHGQFLKHNHRYHKALKAYAKSGDPNAFAEGLQKAGYATDPHYAALLKSIIKKHNLHKYDGAVHKPSAPH